MKYQYTPGLYLSPGFIKVDFIGFICAVVISAEKHVIAKSKYKVLAFIVLIWLKAVQGMI